MPSTVTAFGGVPGSTAVKSPPGAAANWLAGAGRLTDIGARPAPKMRTSELTGWGASPCGGPASAPMVAPSTGATSGLAAFFVGAVRQPSTVAACFAAGNRMSRWDSSRRRRARRSP